MPVVDKLPAMLREDLESAFEDDLDNVFDITNLRHSVGQQKRQTEIELKRVPFHSFHSPSVIVNLEVISPFCFFEPCQNLQVQKLKEKFRYIHEQLNSQQPKFGQ